MCSRSAETANGTDMRPEPWVCLLCGERAAHWSDGTLDVEFREGAYSVKGFVHEHCDSCGEDTIDAEQMDGVQRAAVALARAALDRLSSADIKQMRLDLGLTQADLEAQLGVGRGTVGRWERGTVLQGATVDRLMRLIGAHPELLAELGYVAREGRGPYRTREKPGGE